MFQTWGVVMISLRRFTVFIVLTLFAGQSLAQETEQVTVWRLGSGSGADVNLNFDTAPQVCQFYQSIVEAQFPDYIFSHQNNRFLSDTRYECQLFFDGGRERNGETLFEFRSNSANARVIERIIEEPDQESQCEALEGTTFTDSFNHFFDGEPPDLSGLNCANFCSVNTEVDIQTTYEQIDGVFTPVAEQYNIFATYNGQVCTVEPETFETPETPEELPEPITNSCTADYYTSPTTGEIICGTPRITSTDDNGVQTSTETDADGNVTTTTEFPDGSTTTQTEHPDGSATTTTTSGTDTTTEYTNNENERPDEACPSNRFNLINGVLTCQDDISSSGSEETDGLLTQTNEILEGISDKLDWEAPPSEVYEFTSIDEEIANARDELDNTLDAITANFKEAMSVDISLNTFECNRTYNVLGQTLRFCVPESALALMGIMGQVLLFIAHFTAFQIIFRN